MGKILNFHIHVTPQGKRVVTSDDKNLPTAMNRQVTR